MTIGHELEITQHPLQPRQLHFKRMLGAFRRGSVSLAGKADGRAHTSASCSGKRFVDRDCPQRRRISIALIDGSEVEGFVVRGAITTTRENLRPFSAA